MSTTTTSTGRIDRIFADLRARGGKGLMPFVCGGYPGPGVLPGLLAAMERAGASVVEVGFPFSDPIADGPVIASAMYDALGKGATPQSVLDEIHTARTQGVTVGIVAMVSVSIVWRLGARAFVQSAKAAGVDGFIIPDLIVDEAGDVLEMVREAGLTASLLVAPTSTPERAARIARASSGFVYMLARAGITGESSGGPTHIGERVRALRSSTSLPIACGFGISTAEHVRAVVHEGGADAAIAGSVLVRRMQEAVAGGRDPVEAAETLVRELAKGLTPAGL